MTYEQVKQDEAVRVYIDQADASLKALGFTEHSFQHVTRVAQTAGWILETLGYPERTVELVKIAGYLHDIGNVVNRVDHSQSGAVMAFRILDRMNFPPGGNCRHCHGHRQPRRRHPAAGERLRGSADSGGQIRRSPFQSAGQGYRGAGHPRPGELLRDGLPSGI